MRTLFIIRHAKSSWEDDPLTDIDRPLNKRGRYDAPIMGGVLRNLSVSFDLMVSSPAKRAITTASLIANEVGYPESGVVVVRDLYEAGVGDLRRVIGDFDDLRSRVALIGHNPGLTMLAESFVAVPIESVPTCGIVQIRFACRSWRGVSPENAELVSFDCPKNHK